MGICMSLHKNGEPDQDSLDFLETLLNPNFSFPTKKWRLYVLRCKALIPHAFFVIIGEDETTHEKTIFRSDWTSTASNGTKRKMISAATITVEKLDMEFFKVLDKKYDYVVEDIEPSVAEALTQKVYDDLNDPTKVYVVFGNAKSYEASLSERNIGSCITWCEDALCHVGLCTLEQPVWKPVNFPHRSVKKIRAQLKR